MINIYYRYIFIYIYKYISIHLVVVHLRISKNVKKGLCDFLCKRAQSQACLSYAKRSQKSRLQVVIFLPLFTGVAEIFQETRRADSGIPCIGSCEDLLILAQVVHDAVHLLWREDSFTIFHDLKPDSPPP